MTSTTGIIMLSERERMLNSSTSFLVSVTRITEHAAKVTDNSERIERQIAPNAGQKTGALETAKLGQGANKNSTDLTLQLAGLGPDSAAVVLQNKERDIVLEKQLGRKDRPGHNKGEPEPGIERDMERGR